MNGPNLIDSVFSTDPAPNAAQVGGEIYNFASQMPGAASGTNCPQYFGSAYCHAWIDFSQYTINNGAWTDFNADGAGTQYNLAAFGWSNPWNPSHHIDVWDPACTSG
jgi:hypothetical protein